MVLTIIFRIYSISFTREKKKIILSSRQSFQNKFPIRDHGLFVVSTGDKLICHDVNGINFTEVLRNRNFGKRIIYVDYFPEFHPVEILPHSLLLGAGFETLITSIHTII